MSVSDALERDLEAMPEVVRRSALAAGARVAAEILDCRPGTRDTASLLKELRATVADLKALAEAVPTESDPIDELKRRRDARVSETQVSDGSDRGGRRVGE